METPMHYLKGAMPKDDDDEKDESFSEQMKADKNKDPDTEELEKDPLDVEDEAKETEEDEDEAAKVKADARDEDLDEEEQTYKKRYGDLKSDRDEKVKVLHALMTENARLKAVQTTAVDVNEAQLVKEMQDGIFADVSAITETDPAKAREAAYKVIGKHQALTIKRAVELAVKTIETKREQEVQQTTDVERNRAGATKLAKIALKEIGLDPEKHIGAFQHEVDLQMETDADWFKAIPAEQHFIRLAKRVQHLITKNQQANDEHRRDAGGTITSSSRARRPGSSTKDEGEDGEMDTMRGAMGLATRANYARGARAFKLANVQR